MNEISVARSLSEIRLPTAVAPDLSKFYDPFRSIVTTIRLKRSKNLTQICTTS